MAASSEDVATQELPEASATAVTVPAIIGSLQGVIAARATLSLEERTELADTLRSFAMALLDENELSSLSTPSASIQPSDAGRQLKNNKRAVAARAKRAEKAGRSNGTCVAASVQVSAKREAKTE